MDIVAVTSIFLRKPHKSFSTKGNVQKNSAFRNDKSLDENTEECAHCQESNTRYGCSFRRVQYSFHNPTAITPMATATENPPKNDPASNFRPEPVVALVTVVVGDSVAVVRFPSVGRPHTTEKN